MLEALHRYYREVRLAPEYLEWAHSRDEGASLLLHGNKGGRARPHMKGFTRRDTWLLGPGSYIDLPSKPVTRVHWLGLRMRRYLTKYHQEALAEAIDKGASAIYAPLLAQTTKLCERLIDHWAKVSYSIDLEESEYWDYFYPKFVESLEQIRLALPALPAGVVADIAQRTADISADISEKKQISEEKSLPRDDELLRLVKQIQTVRKSDPNATLKSIAEDFFDGNTRTADSKLRNLRRHPVLKKMLPK